MSLSKKQLAMAETEPSSEASSVSASAAEAAEPAADAPEATASTSSALVILAFPGTEDKMRALWARALRVNSADLTVRAFTPGEELADVLAELVADDAIAERFTIIPANTFPAKPVAEHEVETPMVYVTKNGKRSFHSCLPMQFEKEIIIADLVSGADTEALCAHYATYEGITPLDTGYTFGNVVTPVGRGNPCVNLVIEAFIRKKYVAATTPEAWGAIEHLVDQLLEP